MGASFNEEQILDIAEIMESVLYKHGLIKETKVVHELEQEIEEVKQSEPPQERVEYEKRSDIKYLDLVDLFGIFTRDLEMSANDATYEYMERRMDFLDEEVAELRKAIKNKDRVGVAHEGADVAFVAITQIYMNFIQDGFSHVQAVVKTRSALLEVGKSNAIKCVPTEAGAKIKKPRIWEAPNIADLFLTPEQRLELQKKERERVPATEEEREAIKAHVEGKADG